MGERGRPKGLKVSARVYLEVEKAVTGAQRRGLLEIQDLARRVCDEHARPCNEDPYVRYNLKKLHAMPTPRQPLTIEQLDKRLKACVSSDRGWIYRALSGLNRKDPRRAAAMTHEDAKCLIFRAKHLGGIAQAEFHRLSLLIGQDEPNPASPDFAVFPGAAGAIVNEVVRIVGQTLPAIGRDGKKERDLVKALTPFFKAHEHKGRDYWWSDYFEDITGPAPALVGRMRERQ